MLMVGLEFSGVGLFDGTALNRPGGVLRPGT
jgi:hypothetical protein